MKSTFGSAARGCARMHGEPTIMRHLGRWIVILNVVLAAFAGPSARADAMRYDAVDLGRLPGGRGTIAYGLNDLGQVVGESRGAYGPGTPFLYSNGTMTSLAPTYYNAWGINNSGQIATFEDRAINNAGQTVRAGGVDGHAFIQLGGTVTDIGGLALSTGTSPDAINDSGQVVGGAFINGVYHPFLYSGGHYTDLGLQGAHNGEATAINNHGQILVELGSQFSTEARSLLFSGGHYTDLGSLGGTLTSATGINDHGQIVGAASLAAYSQSSHAFLYESGMIHDLNDLIASGAAGLTLTDARAINNRGQILARATDSQGNFHSFLLTPQTVPEPSSLALAAMFGSALIARHVWRRRPRGTDAKSDGKGDITEWHELKLQLSFVVGGCGAPTLAHSSAETASSCA